MMSNVSVEGIVEDVAEDERDRRRRRPASLARSWAMATISGDEVDARDLGPVRAWPGGTPRRRSRCRRRAPDAGPERPPSCEQRYSVVSGPPVLM